MKIFKILTVFLICLCWLASLAIADYYECKCKDGTIHFSNVPLKGCECRFYKTPPEQQLLQTYYDDPFLLAEAIVKSAGDARKGEFHKEVVVGSYIFRIDFYTYLDELKVTRLSLEENCAISYVRYKTTTTGIKWDPKTGKHYEVPIVSELYYREFWVIASAIDDLLGRARKGDPVLLHTDSFNKYGAAQLLRDSKFLLYFLPKEVQEKSK